MLFRSIKLCEIDQPIVLSMILCQVGHLWSHVQPAWGYLLEGDPWCYLGLPGAWSIGSVARFPGALALATAAVPGSRARDIHSGLGNDGSSDSSEWDKRVQKG